jgi:TolB protein
MMIMFALIIGAPILSAQESAQAKSAIAYTRLTDGYWQIWSKELDGEAKQITTTKFDKRTPVWSPSSKQILFRSGNRELFLVDLQTSGERQLLKELGWIVDPIFKDEARLIFSRFDGNLKDKSDLYTSDLEGKERKLLTNKTGLQYAPALSPDGKTLAYLSGKGHGTHELYLLGLESKQETRLTDNRALELNPTWSPDGKSIAYASDESGNFDIYVMDLKTHKSVKLTDWEGADLTPDWSPDGKQIAFTSDRGGTLQVWVMDSDGGNAKLLVDEKAASQEPSWR